ncbi:MAG: hypothetical protein EP330_20490 [Deltaproteobacteria bacterium]|nr:MAG: hypothetical protein EP330_20490 [Deltaproteobacteria bacterium]
MSWLGLFAALALASPEDTASFEAWATRIPEPPDAEVAEDYRFQHDVFGQIAASMADHPVDVEKIGATHQGRPIWAFHLVPDGEIERKVLVFAGIHALEWISVEVATDLLLESMRSPPPGVQLTVIPLLNPDGRAKVEQDLREGETRYRRGNAKNVDLNRDFTVHRDARAVWKRIIPGYYATSPGEEGLSQPESQALDALAAREQYDRAASLHAFGGYFYHPWSGRWARTEDQAEFVRLGRMMEDAQGDHAYKTRQLSRWGFFFRAQGTELDHLYGTYGTYAFLIELTRSGIRPLKPRTWRTYFRWYNPEDADPHRARGLQAVRALVRED